MNRENTLKLRNSFTNLYPKLHPHYPNSHVLFHFECRDGWFQIIWDLSEKLENEIIAMKAKNDLTTGERSAPHAVAVKEEYGTLSFYMSSYTKGITAAIKEADKRSEVTCEFCGAPGELRGDKWTYTLCEEHKDKKGNSK